MKTVSLSNKLYPYFMENVVMHPDKFKRYAIYGQIAAWSMLSFIYWMDIKDYTSQSLSLVYVVITMLSILIPVYVHYFKVLPLLQKNKMIYYLSSTFLLILAFSILGNITLYLIDFGFEEEETFWGDVFYCFFLITLIVGVSSLFYFVEAWYNNSVIESRLRNEKLEAELNFLKSQINPHFLFNTLNNIYSYVQIGNEKAGPMLEKLSAILRFMVYECSEEKVPLTKELEAVQSLLEIHKMKNSEQQNINLEITGVKRFHLIAPLIIVNCVENACKHSDVIHNKDGFLNIRLAVNAQDQCFFEIHNTYKDRKDTSQKFAGIGQANIQQRLELQYKNAYSWQEERTNNQYKLTLNVPLIRKIWATKC